MSTSNRRSVPGALPLLLALAVPACRQDTVEPAPVCDGVTGLTVIRAVDHPGGGRELTARLRFANGIPIAEADLVRCLSVDQGAAPSNAVAARRMEAGYTLLLVDPGTTARDADVTRAMVEALVKRRPPTEQIAVYRWAAQATQVVPFGTDRAFLAARMAATFTATTEQPQPAAEVMATVAPVLSAVGGTAADALRTIVLVGPRTPALASLATAVRAADPHLVLWLGAALPAAQESMLAALPPGQRFAIAGTQGSTSAVAALSGRLDAYRNHAHYGVGLCGAPAARTVDLRFEGAETSTVNLGAALEENIPGACRAVDLAAGQRAYPRRIELIFTPEQKAAAALAGADKVNKPEFELSVRVAGSSQAVAAPARAHYRGDSSYFCARRNYSINLVGQTPRYVFPGFATDKFHLVAMCLDRLYLRNFTAIQFLASEGLFPIPFAMVEVTVDGVSQGPYLVLENVTDSLRVHQSRATSVVRRYTNPMTLGTLAEVRWSRGTDDEALASYERMAGVGVGLSGQRLEDALRTRLALDQYFTWTALMALIGSGDYVDEVFFYATEATAPDGTSVPSDHFSVMGWDQDDMFSACHYSGKASIHDPDGLVECSESELDKRIYADPHVYRRYAEVLGQVLERHPPERFAEMLGGTAQRLLGFFRDPQILSAMVELRRLNPDAVMNYEVARTMMESELELIVTQYEKKRTDLRQRLARFLARQ
jgi:hypothetical protein